MHRPERHQANRLIRSALFGVLGFGLMGAMCDAPTDAAPAVVLTESSRAFSAVAGGGDPEVQTVALAGDLAGGASGLTIGTITYGPGPTGWLSATLDVSESTPRVRLRPTTGTLPAGTYTAAVPVLSGRSTTSATPPAITVTFIVTPGITLGATSRAFTAVAGGPNPPSQSVSLSNSGSGVLTGVGIGAIVYGTGAAGWLTASLNLTTAPAGVMLAVTTGALAPGTYTATVPVFAAGAGVATNPQNIVVTFTVTAADGPAIGLTPATRAFTAGVGGSSPATQTVSVVNVGIGALGGLSIGTITYGGGATGWLTATLSATTAPATVALTVTTGSLPAGNYTATVPVTSSANGVAPRSIAVTFSVAFVDGPRIAITPTSRTFSAAFGGPNPAPQTVSIVNGGGGTLSGLTLGPIVYGPGATGWLVDSLSATIAPSILKLAPITGTLAPGSYTATIQVMSTATGVSPMTVTVALVVTSPPPGPIIYLSATSKAFTAVAGGPNPPVQTITVGNSGGGTLTGLAVGPVTYGTGGAGWLTATISTSNSSAAGTTALATITLAVTTGTLAPGTYVAVVPVASTATGIVNSPQNVSVILVVASPPPHSED